MPSANNASARDVRNPPGDRLRSWRHPLEPMANVASAGTERQELPVQRKSTFMIYSFRGVEGGENGF